MTDANVPEAETTEKPKKRRGRPPKAKAVETPVINNDARISELEAQIKLMTSALLSSREVVNTEDDATIGVMKTGGGNLSMFLTDAYGREKHFYWEDDGQVLYMTPAQYEEIATLPGGQKFFDRHWLQLETDELSMYMDTDSFIKNLEYDGVHDHIDNIEEPSILQRILSHLESIRVITEDETGEPLTDSEGLPEARIVEWSVKQRMVAQACVDRLHTLTGVRYSLADG